MKRDFHFTMASSLLARLCLEHPEEALISISGEPIHGVAAVRAIKARGKEWFSDCPIPDETGKCPGHAIES